MMYPAIYWAECCDEITFEPYKVSGCTFAETFAEATYQIEKYYGEALCSLKITLLPEGDVLEFANRKEAKAIVTKVD